MGAPTSTDDQEQRTQSGALLSTIKLPRVLRNLADRLPKPNYESSLDNHNSMAAAQQAKFRKAGSLVTNTPASRSPRQGNHQQHHGGQ